MFTGIYRVSIGKSECGDFKFMGIACLPIIPVILKSPHSHFHCNICGEFDFTGILWGYPTSCREIMYQLWGNNVIMKYEIKLYREMHVSFTSKTHVDVMFVGI